MDASRPRISEGITIEYRMLSSFLTRDAILPRRRKLPL